MIVQRLSIAYNKPRQCYIDKLINNLAVVTAFVYARPTLKTIASGARDRLTAFDNLAEFLRSSMAPQLFTL